MLYRAGSAHKVYEGNVLHHGPTDFNRDAQAGLNHPLISLFSVSNVFPKQRNRAVYFETVCGAASIATFGVLGSLSPMQCNTGSGCVEADLGFSGVRNASQVTRTVTAYGRKRLNLCSLHIPQSKKGFCALRYAGVLRLLYDIGIDVYEKRSETSARRHRRASNCPPTMILEPETPSTARHIRNALQQALWELKSKLKDAIQTSSGFSLLSPDELDNLVLCCHVRCLVPELLCKAQAAAGPIPANHIQTIMNTTQSALNNYATNQIFVDWKSVVALEKKKLKEQVPIIFPGITLERVKKCLVLATQHVTESTSALHSLYNSLKSRSSRLKTSDADGSTNDALMKVQDALKSALPAYREAITFISLKTNPFRLSTLFPISIPDEPPRESVMASPVDPSDSTGNNSYTFEGSQTLYDLVDILAAFSQGLVLFRRLQRLKNFKDAFEFWEKHFNVTPKKLKELDPQLAAMQQHQDYNTLQEQFHSTVLASTYARQNITRKTFTRANIVTPQDLKSMLESQLRIVIKTIHLRVSKLVDDALLCRQLQLKFTESEDQEAKAAAERLERYGNELTLACDCIKKKLKDFSMKIKEPLRSPSASPEPSTWNNGKSLQFLPTSSEPFTAEMIEPVEFPSTSSEHFTLGNEDSFGCPHNSPGTFSLKKRDTFKLPTLPPDVNTSPERPQQKQNDINNTVLKTTSFTSSSSNPDIVRQTSSSTVASVWLPADVTRATMVRDKPYQDYSTSKTGTPREVMNRPSVICFAPASHKTLAVNVSSLNAEKAPQVNVVRRSEQDTKHSSRLDKTHGGRKYQSDALRGTTFSPKRRLDLDPESVLKANKSNSEKKHLKGEPCNSQPRAPTPLEKLQATTSALNKNSILPPYRPGGSSRGDQHLQRGSTARGTSASAHRASPEPGSVRKKLLSFSNIVALKRLMHNKLARKRERRMHAVTNIWRPF